MAYLGSSPKFSNYVPDLFTGTGSQTVFTMSNAVALPGSILVIIDGVKQISDTYTVSGTTLTFSEAPGLGSSIEINYLAIKGVINVPADGSVGTSQLADESITAEKFAFGGGFGFRNKIIGGDFTLNPWQRGTSFAAPVSGSYTADRWAYGIAGSGAASILKTADAPTASQAGMFTQHCLHVDVTTADAAIAAGDFLNLGQRIEGYNAAAFGFGQAGARFVTLSFWVKGSKTGIHCVGLSNTAADRSYVAEYTINVADTWEYKTITIAVDTTGTWLYDNGIGLNLRFALAAGTTFQTAAGAWAAGNFFASANQVNGLDSTANNFKIALVQLEAGEVATPFEQRSFGQELELCQRYYEKSYNTEDAPGTITDSGAATVRNSAAGAVGLPGLEVKIIKKRINPIITWYSPNNGVADRVYNINAALNHTIISNSYSGQTSTGYPTSSSTFSESQAVAGHWVANAEL